MSHETAAIKIDSPTTAFPGIYSRRDQIHPLLEGRITETVSQQMGKSVGDLLTLRMPYVTGRVLAGFGVVGLAVGVALSIFSPGSGRPSVEAAAVPTSTPAPRISFQCNELVNPRVDTRPSEYKPTEMLLLEKWRTVYKRGPRSSEEAKRDAELELRMGAEVGTIIKVIDQNVQITGGDCEIPNTNY